MAACRKREGLSQEQLAEMLFCARSGISKVESNTTTLKADFLFSWAKATNSTDAVVSFICGEEGIRWMIDKLKSEGHWVECAEK